MITQAERVIAKFGTAYDLAKALAAVGVKRSHVAIYRWTWPPPKGTGGLIPSGLTFSILAAARKAGVALTEAELSPFPSPREDPARGPAPAVELGDLL